MIDYCVPGRPISEDESMLIFYRLKRLGKYYLVVNGHLIANMNILHFLRRERPYFSTCVQGNLGLWCLAYCWGIRVCSRDPSPGEFPLLWHKVMVMYKIHTRDMKRRRTRTAVLDILVKQFEYGCIFIPATSSK